MGIRQKKFIKKLLADHADARNIACPSVLEGVCFDIIFNHLQESTSILSRVRGNAHVPFLGKHVEARDEGCHEPWLALVLRPEEIQYHRAVYPFPVAALQALSPRRACSRLDGLDRVEVRGGISDEEEGVVYRVGLLQEFCVFREVVEQVIPVFLAKAYFIW